MQTLVPFNNQPMITKQIVKDAETRGKPIETPGKDTVTLKQDTEQGQPTK